MSKPDLTKLSLPELQAVIDEAQAIAKERRSEELKVRVDGWAEEAEADGFARDAVIEAFKSYVGRNKTSKARAPRGSVVKEPKAYLKGVTYKNPNGPETWIGGSLGRQPPWLRQLVPSTLPLEERAKQFSGLAVKKK